MRLILRLGAAQLLFLDTPPHAAVGTSVDLARAQKLAPFAGMINAVLRRVAEGGTAALADLDSPRLDTPGWLWASWGLSARALALAHQNEAPLDLTLKPGAALPADGILLPSGSVRLPAGTRVADLPGFRPGRFLGAGRRRCLAGETACRSEGRGRWPISAPPPVAKTAQLAAAGATVTAIEASEKRIPRLRENLTRLGLPATVLQADATIWRPERLLDAVLLDAPCSATGTIRRHPDLPHIKRATDIAALTAGQDRLIEAASAMLRPGGRLIYAVCSLQDEEGAGAYRHRCSLRLGARALFAWGIGVSARGAHGGR